MGVFVEQGKAMLLQKQSDKRDGAPSVLAVKEKNLGRTHLIDQEVKNSGGNFVPSGLQDCVNVALQ